MSASRHVQVAAQSPEWGQQRAAHDDPPPGRDYLPQGVLWSEAVAMCVDVADEHPEIAPRYLKWLADEARLPPPSRRADRTSRALSEKTQAADGRRSSWAYSGRSSKSHPTTAGCPALAALAASRTQGCSSQMSGGPGVSGSGVS